jgi:predicted metalloprotease with PDZ domain
MTRPPNRSEAILAVVRPLDLALHEVEVSLTLPAGTVERGAVLALPAWTPGSYLVRDYARFLDRLRAADGQGRPVAAAKLDKQRWSLASAEGPVTVSYRLFCNDLTVRTNHVDLDHAQLVGAGTFLRPEERLSRPYRVTFQDWPTGWKVASALPEADGWFAAAGFDELVDAPFELGPLRLHRFELDGCQFRLAVNGAHPGDEQRILDGCQAVAAACSALFGGFPFARYLFLLTFSPGCRGGLEHRDCCSLLADPAQLEKAEGWWDLFTLVAHELFHAWNVKRLRDPALGPFDYQGENFTRLLWFHEGFTSFMQYTLVLRAGLAPWSWVAKRLSSSWTDNVTRAGRLEQSLEEASFDAWIRHYKPTEFSTNSTVSYYDKGSLVGWMMDSDLRLASGGEFGLDRWFALLWQRFGDGPVTDQDLRASYRELSGKDPAVFWDAYIQGREELDARRIERAYGLRFNARAPWELPGGGELEDPEARRRARVYSGLAFNGEATVVANVAPGSPAAAAGLGYGVEIVAVDGWRTPAAADVLRHLGDRNPGDEVEVLAAERGRTRTCRLTLAESPQRSVQVGLDPGAGTLQREAFSAWTGQPYPVPASRPAP